MQRFHVGFAAVVSLATYDQGLGVVSTIDLGALSETDTTSVNDITLAECDETNTVAFGPLP